ncbi:MAG: PAS domain-containing protein [Actinobacteria bacterium]|nr:PAS domain-containing protein [Actinomycetota bacterium]
MVFKESTKVELDLVLNTVVEGILIINADDLIIYCNEPGAKLRNTKVEEVLGKPVLDCHSADFYESVKKIIDDLKSGKKPYHKRLVNVGSNYFEITYSKLNGELLQYQEMLLKEFCWRLI